MEMEMEMEMERNNRDYAHIEQIEKLRNERNRSYLNADNNYNDYDNKRYFGDLNENNRKAQTINMRISGSEDGTLFRAKISLPEKIKEEEKLLSKKEIEKAKNE